MISLEAAISRGHKNNFTIIRLVCAAMVLWGHSFGIVGADPMTDPFTRLVNGITWSGDIGVGVFFITSGFLVFRSLETSRSLVKFAKARFLRIFPGLLVANVLTVTACWAIYVGGSPLAFMGDESVKMFLLNNTLLFENVYPWINGVFSTHPHSFVNGSLWTLPAEIRLYFSLFLLGLAGVFATSYLPESRKAAHVTTNFFLLIVLALTFIDFKAIPIVGFNERHAYPTQLFLMGMLFYTNRSHIILNRQLFLAALATLYILTNFRDYYAYSTLLLYPYIVLYLAYSAPYIEKLNNGGDMSYGLYLYAWPVQQIVFSANKTMSAYTNIAISLIVTAIVAFLSWKFIEKPALKFKDFSILSYFSRKPLNNMER